MRGQGQYSNKIVGYSIGSRMKSGLAAAGLRMSIGLRCPEGTIVRSDRGSQFRSKKVVRLLKNNGLRGSMGRVGTSSHNAAMESFFSPAAENVLDTRRWDNRGPPPRGRQLDRNQVQPTPSATTPRAPDAHRV